MVLCLLHKGPEGEEINPGVVSTPQGTRGGRRLTLVLCPLHKGPEGEETNPGIVSTPQGTGGGGD